MIKLYCWDTTLLLSLLNDEPGTPYEDIDIISQEVDEGKSALLIPKIVIAEI